MFDIDTGILENPNGVDGSTWETVELDSSLGALELGLGLDYPGDGYIIHYYVDGEQTGYATFSVDHIGRVVYWGFLDPFEEAPELKGQGLGALINVLSILYLVHHEGLEADYAVVSSSFTDDGSGLGNALNYDGAKKALDDYLADCIAYITTRGFELENPFE